MSQATMMSREAVKQLIKHLDREITACRRQSYSGCLVQGIVRYLGVPGNEEVRDLRLALEGAPELIGYTPDLLVVHNTIEVRIIT